MPEDTHRVGIDGTLEYLNKWIVRPIAIVAAFITIYVLISAVANQDTATLFGLSVLPGGDLGSGHLDMAQLGTWWESLWPNRWFRNIVLCAIVAALLLFVRVCASFAAELSEPWLLVAIAAIIASDWTIGVFYTQYIRPSVGLGFAIALVSVTLLLPTAAQRTFDRTRRYRENLVHRGIGGILLLVSGLILGPIVFALLGTGILSPDS